MSSWSPILGLAKLKQGRTKTWVKLLAEHQGVEIHTTEPAGGPAQVENPFAHYSGRFKLSSFSKSFWVWTTSPAARWARIREVEMPKPSQTALSGSCEVHKHLNLRPVGRNPDDFPLTVGTLSTCVTFIPSRCIDEALHLQVVRFGYKPSPNLPAKLVRGCLTRLEIVYDGAAITRRRESLRSYQMREIFPACDRFF